MCVRYAHHIHSFWFGFVLAVLCQKQSPRFFRGLFLINNFDNILIAYWGTANISEILYAKQNINERIHRIICQRINIYSKYQSPTVNQRYF